MSAKAAVSGMRGGRAAQGAGAGGPAPSAVAPAPMDAAALRQWIARASAGDTVVYARCGAPSATLRAAATARDRGLVTTHINRAPVSGVMQYVARRTAAPFAPGDLTDAPPPRHFLRTSPEARILRLLAEAARRGLACPSNLSLARAAGLPGGVCASYRLRKLVRAGMIRIEHRAADLPRVVTIVSSGLSTTEVGR